MENNTNIQENELYTKFKELFTDKRLNVFNLQISKKFKNDYIDVYNYIIKEYNIPEGLPHEEYKKHLYKAYIGLKEIPKCPVCGRDVAYDRKARFHTTCDDKECKKSPIYKEIVELKRIQTCLERYGTESPLQAEEIKEKIKLTNIKKYGVENPFAAEEVKEKIKNTMLEWYGVEHALLYEDFYNKMTETTIERYGVENASQAEEIKHKKINTCLEHYGVEYSFQAEEIKEQIKQTCLEKYGVLQIFQAEEIKEQIKQTMLERYGVEHPAQYEQFKEKSKQTMLERYGVEHALLSEEFHNKMTNTMFECYGVENAIYSPELKEKMIQTNLERYGVENVSQSEEIKQKKIDTVIEHYGSYENYLDVIHLKAKQTRRENSERYCGMTPPEYYTYLFLVKHFGTSDIMYDSIIDSRYPFHVDFYISSLDIFIEINAHWSHNTHLFNQDNQDDINEALFLQEKAEDSSNYKSAYQVWTQRDPLKVQTAIDNNLLYIPIWSDKIDIITQSITEFFTEHNLQLPEPTFNYTEDEIINYMKENL